jgi:vacuolar iron transporter family protein
MRSDLPNEKHRFVQYLSNIQREIDSAALYQTLSDSESKPEIAEVYKRLAAMEDAHAEFWKERFAKLGHELPKLSIGWRTRSLMWLARRFGPDFVLPVVSSREHADCQSLQCSI